MLKYALSRSLLVSGVNLSGGGEWGGALRKAGFDFLVIEGKAEEAKYIVIDNGKVLIKLRVP